MNKRKTSTHITLSFLSKSYSKVPYLSFISFTKSIFLFIFDFSHQIESFVLYFLIDLVAEIAQKRFQLRSSWRSVGLNCLLFLLNCAPWRSFFSIYFPFVCYFVFFSFRLPWQKKNNKKTQYKKLCVKIVTRKGRIGIVLKKSVRRWEFWTKDWCISLNFCDKSKMHPWQNREVPKWKLNSFLIMLKFY